MNDRGRGTVARAPGLVSVVAPAHNEAGLVGEFCRRTRSVLSGLFDFELIIVDDGSTDDTHRILERLAADDDRLRVLVLSRNFGHQAALTAGLEHARGDLVVMLDSDLQDPPELIPRLIEEWSHGSDIVYAVRERRLGESRFKLFTARWFYRVFDMLSDVDVPHNAGDFRLLDRKPLDAVLGMRERNRFLRGMTVWVGFRQSAVSYSRDPRYTGESKYTPRRMVRLSLDAIASFSQKPLRLAAWMGFIFAALAFVAIPVIVTLRLLGHYIPGFAAVTIVILLIGGVQLIAIGIIGEYLGQMYDELKGRPLYVIRRSINVERLADDSIATTASPRVDR